APGVYTIGMLMDPALGRVIERCRDGDRDAFEEVVDRYGLQLLRTARLILRDQSLAEDAVQETFLRAWQRIGSLRDEDPGPWLNRIAMNESISAYRRRHRFQALTERFGRLGGGKHQVSSEARLDLAQALALALVAVAVLAVRSPQVILNDVRSTVTQIFTTPSPSPTPQPFICSDRSGGTTGLPGQLTGIRVAHHAEAPGFDRMVFDFSGGIPSYDLTRQESPTFVKDASGQSVTLDGW